jgi:CxxC motif-containing protein (DUF1111 family)
MGTVGTRALLLAAGVAVCAFAVAAELGTGGAPTGHRHKLKPASASAHPSAQGKTTPFGSSVPGLTSAELAAFEEGREEFESVETPEGGLGPIFNNNACAACHNAPLTGGFGTTTETRFGRLTDSRFDSLSRLGGSLLQQNAVDPSILETVPAQANVVAQRLTTPLFGAGLIEAISDADIKRNARLPKPDGVKGRAAVLTDIVSGQRRIGRFGWKAQHATVLAFSGDAYLNEMGVTNRFFSKENAPNGNEALLEPFITNTGLDDPPDPDTGRSDIDASADFVRMLAAPPALRLTVSGLLGQRLFDEIKCTACHVPSMTSGASTIQALTGKTVPLYSDLLLHDMGALGDGIKQGTAKGSEMKTAPLWGLRARTRFLHDGRAATVNDAILAHDGEAAVAAGRYRELSSTEVKTLLDFLNSI